MSDNIPFEMQVEIMKKLPVKSLVVFRTVSKEWKSIIDSPLFITDHTSMRRHHRLLIRYEVGTYSDYNVKYVSIKDADTFSQHPVRNVPVSLGQLKELETVGMSQGLLCLSGYYREDGCWKKKTAVIWNPSLGKSIAIGVPGRFTICFKQRNIHRVQSIGFGVRPDNFDSMIVMVCNVLHSKPVMVFTLSSRVWRVPCGKLPAKSVYFANMYPVATHDRCIYWKAYERVRKLNLVVAFDMVSEDFMKINLPNVVAHRSYSKFSISMIKDSLALLEYYDDAKKDVCDVWMMVEDGVSKSFTKLFTITLGALLHTHVLGFTKNDQPIMGTTKHWPIEVYEPRTGSIKNLRIYGKRGSFFCSSYTETLLLLHHLDGQFIEIQLRLYSSH